MESDCALFCGADRGLSIEKGLISLGPSCFPGLLKQMWEHMCYMSQFFRHLTVRPQAKVAIQHNCILFAQI